MTADSSFLVRLTTLANALGQTTGFVLQALEQAELSLWAIEGQPVFDSQMAARVQMTFDRCQGLSRYSTDESDEYWQLAEELILQYGKTKGLEVKREPPQD